MRKEQAEQLIEAALAKQNSPLYQMLEIKSLIDQHPDQKHTLFSVFIKNYFNPLMMQIESPYLLQTTTVSLAKQYDSHAERELLLNTFLEHQLHRVFRTPTLDQFERYLGKIAELFAEIENHHLILPLFIQHYFDSLIQQYDSESLANFFSQLAPVFPDHAEILKGDLEHIKDYFAAENNRPIREAVEALSEHTTLPEDMIVEISGYTANQLFHPNRAAAEKAARDEYNNFSLQA